MIQVWMGRSEKKGIIRMRVFVSDATGYVGLNVARSFHREVHHISGMIRFENKKYLLLKSEIFPAVGDMRKPDIFKKYLPQMEIPVHADLAIDQRMDLIKVRSIPGWNPRHHGFIQNVSIYYQPWKSFRNEQR